MPMEPEEPPASDTDATAQTEKTKKQAS
jgi:hypothetical protein